MGHARQLAAALAALAIACLALLDGRAVVAQEGQTGGAGRLAPPSNGYSVFIIGDALAGGLWAGTTRLAPGYPEFVVNGRFKEESGLGRPEIYDWGQAVPKILERHHIDIAIVLIGTNDGQDIRSDTGTIAFGSPEWVAAYEAAVDGVMRVFKEHKVGVYWVGLPPMRSDRHEEAVRKIAEVQRGRAAANGVKYIDIRPEFANPDGSYAESGPGVDGRTVRLRSLNGVKFIKAGNDKLAKLVLDAIRADLGLAPAGAVSAVLPEDDGAGEQQSALPIFGQALAGGGARTLSPADLPAAGPGELADAPQAPTRTVDLEAGTTAPEETAVTAPSPDSAAAALFTTGKWPAPQPGRIDDFRWPPQ